MTHEEMTYNWLKVLRLESVITWPIMVIVMMVLFERGHHTAFFYVLALEILSGIYSSKRMDMLQDRLNIPHP